MRPGGAAATLRRRVFDVVEGSGEKAALSGAFSAGLIVLVLVNVVAAIFETVPSLLAAHRFLFLAIERVSLVVFAVEYLVRLWVSVEQPRYHGRPAWRARLAYAATPAAIIDLIAVLPFFLGLVFDLNLRTVVILRLLRLFKLGRYSTGFQSLYEAVRRERRALLASFLVLFAVVLVAASLIYMAERRAQPVDFGSIPAAMWWALETVTTVGYGDVTPKTLPGRIVGGVTMIAGILMIALPVAIIGSSFAEVLRQRSFVVTFGLVARIPAFAGLPADLLGELLGVIRATTAEAGTPIIAYGGNDDSLYVIATGVVAVETGSGRRQLVTGEAFGTGVEHDAPDARLEALAVTRVKLLKIARADLLDLVARYPDLVPHLALSRRGRRRRRSGAPRSRRRRQPAEGVELVDAGRVAVAAVAAEDDGQAAMRRAVAGEPAEEAPEERREIRRQHEQGRGSRPAHGSSRRRAHSGGSSGRRRPCRARWPPAWRRDRRRWRCRRHRP